MDLGKKKQLASRALGVGMARVSFNNERLADIKEAITKQDIRDLVASGAIKVNAIKGRKTVEKRTSRKRAGKIRMKRKPKNSDYMVLTRKFREYLKQLRMNKGISNENYRKVRSEIRARNFKNRIQLKERIEELKK